MSSGLFLVLAGTGWSSNTAIEYLGSVSLSGDILLMSPSGSVHVRLRRAAGCGLRAQCDSPDTGMLRSLYGSSAEGGLAAMA